MFFLFLLLKEDKSVDENNEFCFHVAPQMEQIPYEALPISSLPNLTEAHSGFVKHI